MYLFQKQKDAQGFGAIETIILVFTVIVFVTAVWMAYSSARATARDGQRVADVTQIQKALNLYKEEYGFFPQSSEGKAVGEENAFSRFMSNWPAPPAPPDGACQAEYNKYSYEQLNSGENYQLTFCLGADYKSLKAGLRSATPDGFK